LMQHGTHGGRGGVFDKCTWRRWIGASDKLALYSSKALRSSASR
jgi:hypothetical protein